MRLLLDTHIFLWYITGDRRLSTHFRVSIENADLFEFLDVYQPGAHAIIDIVVVVRDGIGKVRKLRFQAGLCPVQESLTHVAKTARVLNRAMLEHTLATFEGQVEAGKLGVTFL